MFWHLGKKGGVAEETTQEGVKKAVTGQKKVE